MSWSNMMMALAVKDADPHLGRDGASVELTDTDVAAIRELVRRHLAAFRRGDEDAAWRLLTPGARLQARDPETLLRVVTSRHTPLAEAMQVTFGDVILVPDGIAVVARVTDLEGDAHPALWLVEQDADGRWGTAGWLLVSESQLRGAHGTLAA